MKRVFFIALIAICLSTLGSCKNQTSKSESCCKTEKKTNKSCCGEGNSTKALDNFSATDTQVLYFHFTRRCITCSAIEKTAKTTVESLGGKIKFISFNLEDETTEKIAEKYKVTGQALLVIKNEKMENLTNFAFLNAKTKPERLKEKIISTIKAL